MIQENPLYIMEGKEIGLLISKKREKLNLTMDELAKQTGTSRQNINRYQKWNLIKPDYILLKTIFRILQIDLEISDTGHVSNSTINNKTTSNIQQMGTFGTRLKQYRELKRLSQTEFAEAMGTQQQHIGNWERGRSKIGYDNLNLLKKAFPQLNMDWLETGEGAMTIEVMTKTPINTSTNLRELRVHIDQLEGELLKAYRNYYQMTSTIS